MSKKTKLPVDGFAQQIVDAVKKHPVTILVAETGAGKSTRVPFIVMMGLGRPIIVTQPRRLAAEAVATRVCDENGLVLGGLVGFRTKVSHCDSPDTLCLYCTDGLHLVRELTDSKRSLKNGIVLIIDEVHEFNENIETLLAWSDQLIQQEVDIKVVIMSATLEHESLSRYFNNAPVIHIPGQAFSVSGAPTSSSGPRQLGEPDMLGQIQKSIFRGDNTLVFLSGKKEISELSVKLQGFRTNAEIIELHGDLHPEDQNRIFDSYSKPKLILATNIAQTSVTIPDINCVIDSGNEKRIELWNGVETLVRRNVSKADIKQRAGRAGRTKNGTYVLCNDTPYEKFSDYPVPEICQKRLDQMVLRLATAGFDATELRFFHQPDLETLKESKKMLIDMQALETDGTVTQLGYEINRFPTSVIVARMIVEAIKRKCLTRILTFAAILSNAKSSIKLHPNKYRTDPADFKLWNQMIAPDKEYRSDLLVEFDLWDLGFNNYKMWGQNGIDQECYIDSVDIRKELKQMVVRIGYNPGPEYNQHADNETEVLKCVAAGMIHHVYSHMQGNKYLGSDMRMLFKGSLIHRSGYPALVVGIPQNIQLGKGNGGNGTVLTILSHCTAVELSWLHELAPHLMKTVEYQPAWNYQKLMLTVETVTYFNGREIMRKSVPAEWSDENVVILADALAHVFLPEDEKFVMWIEQLRMNFAQRKLGNSFQFARKFAEAIRKYKVLRISELRMHASDICSIVLNDQSQQKAKKLNLTKVNNNDFVSALAMFANKQGGKLTFDFQEKKIQNTYFFLATCTLTLKGKEYKASGGEWVGKKVLAKHVAARALYEKLETIGDSYSVQSKEVAM